jgi:hypothetical protein
MASNTPIGSRVVIATLATALIGYDCRAQVESDRQLALWRGIKRQLTGPFGMEYFESSVKHAMLPPLKGKLISVLIRDGLSRLTVGITDGETPEVTLIYHTGNRRVKSDPKRGTQIEFEGVAMEFTKEPLMLTLDVPEYRIRGLELEPSKSPK